MSEEILPIAEERIEAKSRGERERYTQLTRVQENSMERQESLLK